MKESQLIELIDGALEVADEASKKVLEIYHSEEQKFENKKDGSPVTEADLTSHQIIHAGLTKLENKIPILSEEGNAKTIPDEDLFWLIDPLDGTKEFINRNGEFTVNIALIKDGAPILGIVFSPAVDENFYGAKNLGAFKLNGTERINIYPTRQNEDVIFAGTEKLSAKGFSEVYLNFEVDEQLFNGNSEISIGRNMLKKG